MKELSKELLEEFEDAFYESENHNVRVPNQYEEGKIRLDIRKELVPYIENKVLLLRNGRLYHDREFIYSFLQTLIDMLPELKQEKDMDPKLCAVYETLLLSIDYLTKESLKSAHYTEEHEKEVRLILSECFELNKTHTFDSESCKTPIFMSEPHVDDEGVYVEGDKETNPEFPVYIAVMFRKQKNKFELFRQLITLMSQCNLDTKSDRISDEEKDRRLTNHQLDSELVHALNRIIRVLYWTTNSTSSKNSELYDFDKFEIGNKLGLFR